MNKILEMLQEVDQSIRDSGFSELDKAELLVKVTKLRADLFERFANKADEDDDSAEPDTQREQSTEAYERSRFEDETHRQ